MRIYSLILLVLTFNLSNSQSLDFESGISISKFKFINSEGSTLEMSPSDPGGYFKIGGNSPIKFGSIRYGISMINFNNRTIIDQSPVIYKTSYLGAFAGWGNTFNHGMEISLLLGLKTIIDGTQEMNNAVYLLKENEEFNGFWLAPSIFLRKTLLDTDSFKASLSYGLTKTFKANYSTIQKLSFFSHIISVNFQFKKNIVAQDEI